MTNQPEQKNPLICDPETGLCELPEETTAPEEVEIKAPDKPLVITYFSDPICSACWGIEPQLRKLQLEYGDYFEMQLHMGGLLPSFEVYDAGGISKPSDVSHHWDEVSEFYEMPIDGDVWLENPLHSSYPPSIAFKAAQLQGEQMGITYLREIRELLFLQKKNITEWEHLSAAAEKAGLNVEQFKLNYEGQAKVFFKEDLGLTRRIGVRGFPTLFFTNYENGQSFIYGFRPYEEFEKHILDLVPDAKKKQIDISWKSLFSIYPTLTLKEYSTLAGIEKSAAESLLNKLHDQNDLDRIDSKNGSLWLSKMGIG